MHYSVLPPEINSALIFAGAGSGPMLAAASAWDGLATELASAAVSFGSVTAGLVGGSWQGRSSVAMAAAAAPYAGWLAAAATQAEQAATQAQVMVAEFEAVRLAMVQPALVAANRSGLISLVISNLFGQNAPAIAAAEAAYEEMWALDVSAMAAYHSGASAVAVALPAFALPLRLPAGLAAGPAAVVTALTTAVGMPTFAGRAIAASLGLANVGGGNLGNANNGLGNIGNANLGNNNLGSGNFGSFNIGSANLGGNNIGIGNAGANNFGLANLGNLNTGFANAGIGNFGIANTGNNNIGNGLLPTRMRSSPLARQSSWRFTRLAARTCSQPGALATDKLRIDDLPVPRDVAGVRAADRKYPIKRCRPGRQVGIGVDIRIG